MAIGDQLYGINRDERTLLLWLQIIKLGIRMILFVFLNEHIASVFRNDPHDGQDDPGEQDKGKDDPCCGIMDKGIHKDSGDNTGQTDQQLFQASLSPAGHANAIGILCDSCISDHVVGKEFLPGGGGVFEQFAIR